MMLWSIVLVLQLVAALTPINFAAAQNAPADEMSFDPMTSSPELTFNTSGWVIGDIDEPDYSAMAVTPDGSYLLLVDNGNSRVKVMVTSSEYPFVTSYVELPQKPWDIALLPDGTVVVTTYFRSDVIYLLRLQDDVISLTSEVSTQRYYQAVTAGLDDNTLIVTSRRYLDVITLEGQVLQSFRVSELTRPVYVCLAGGDDVIVSDLGAEQLFRVNARTGEVVETISHPVMKTPHQAVVDKGGNLYVAGRNSYSLMVRSPEGEWRTLLQDQWYIGVGLTNDCVFACWVSVLIVGDPSKGGWYFRIYSVVEGYSMTDVNRR